MFKRIIAALMLAAFVPIASAATIPLIVTAGPGTGSDNAARTIADLYNKKNTGHTIVVENVAGGRTLPAAKRFLSSKEPAILMGATSLHVVNPALYPQETPYEGIKEFDFIGGMTYITMILYASDRSKTVSFDEFVKKVQKSDKTVMVGVDTLNGEVNVKALIKKYNLKNLQLVRYKNSTETLKDVIAGVIDYGHSAGNPTSLGYAQDGKIKVLGTTWKETQTVGKVSIPPLPIPLIDGVATLSLNTKLVKFDGIDVDQLKKDILAVWADPVFAQKASTTGAIVTQMDAKEVPNWIRAKVQFVKSAMDK